MCYLLCCTLIAYNSRPKQLAGWWWCVFCWLLGSEVSVHHAERERECVLDQGSSHCGRQEGEKERRGGKEELIQEGGKEERREGKGGRMSALSPWTAWEQIFPFRLMFLEMTSQVDPVTGFTNLPGASLANQFDNQSQLSHLLSNLIFKMAARLSSNLEYAELTT